MEAARTCSRLLTPSIHLISGHAHVVSQTAVQVVADVLSKLLVVGITDPGKANGTEAAWGVRELGQSEVASLATWPLRSQPRLVLGWFCQGLAPDNLSIPSDSLVKPISTRQSAVRAFIPTNREKNDSEMEKGV